MVLTGGLIAAVLIFTRISAIFSMLPVFGATNVPMQVRIGLMMVMTIVIYPIVGVGAVASIHTFWDFAYHIGIETLIGLSISLAMNTVYNAIYLAGTIIDMEIGFSMVSVMSATDESEIPVTANFYYLLAMIVFLATDCHHQIIEGIWLCFKNVPIASGVLHLQIVDLMNVIIVQSFVIGVKIAAPFILTLLIADIIMGLLSKAMPGFNIFMVGMPIKILVGLILIFLLIPYTIGIVKFLNDLMIQYMKEIIGFYHGSGI